MIMRVQKYLASQGVCSRREAEDLMKRGLVTVNGVVLETMGAKIDPDTDIVRVLSKASSELTKKTTVILNKPRDIVSSRMENEGESVFDLFPQFENLNIIGRLDKSSEGLLMLSNDGVIARAVTGDHHGIEKEYCVKVREDVFAERLKVLEPGIRLDDGFTLPVKTQRIDRHTFTIILREGRKHQIRRMCEYLHLTVISLQRIRIGSIMLGDLKPGRYRRLTPAEVIELKKQSSKFMTSKTSSLKK